MKMWPMRLELSRDECKKCLRCLELEAYGSMVSVLRAQGSFTGEKQKLLQELAKALHISNERHRAEIRRAVNDEKLSTIAEQLNGPNTGTDWAIEGRRTIPLLPRLKACTVFTSLANSLSLATSVANAKKDLTSREESSDVKVKLEAVSFVEKLEDKELPINSTSAQPEGHSINRKRRRSRIEIENEICSYSYKTQRIVAKIVQTLSAHILKCLNNFRDDPLSFVGVAADLVFDLQEVCVGANPNDDVNNIVKEVTTSAPCKGSESLTPVAVSLSNKVFIVSTSSTSDVLGNSMVDIIAEITTANSSCSTTCTISHPNSSVHPSGSNCNESNSTVQCKPVISQDTSHTHTLTQVSRPLSMVVPAYVTATTTSKVRAVISTQTKSQPRTTPIVIPTCPSQHVNASSEFSGVKINSDSDKSMKMVQLTSCAQKAAKTSSSTSSPCVKRIITSTHSSTKPVVGVKPISTQSGPRMVTINTGTASSGPGPPHLRPTTAVLTCKKMPTIKTGHPATTMGITLNSSKTVNIAPNAGSRVAAKANVIVVQKGPARGVTLSHAGKEVLGKVIMGGKNLCLSNQQSAGSIALLPHRISGNGEQSLTMLSPLNSAQPESVKTNAKSGNMIVFDLRQDSLEKSKVLSEILEASGVFSSESKTAILNTNSHLLIKEQHKDCRTPTSPISKSPLMKSGATISFVMESKDHRKHKETVANVDSDKTDCPPESKIKETEEILISSDCISEIQGTLDPQTGIYSFQTSENTLNNIQTEESISSAGIDIFSTALASADINLESFQYINESESNIVLDDVRNQTLTIDQLNDMYDGHQSISDKSNC